MYSNQVVSVQSLTCLVVDSMFHELSPIHVHLIFDRAWMHGVFVA